ncbi:MAG: type I secretion system permease/ATPase [Limimaricola sp.]|uniref:type I secretion system permease/ATPase n=1 Tax=Limimaricola sp. TaxID=2211665 RepID=UPI001DACAB96|nr:type I secretion system permease/ATPase [Limimaricola sp.]MBI1418722.1 type I secretion system permease/ATPase [Limimaricola sp.]
MAHHVSDNRAGRGAAELRAALRDSRGLLWAVGVFSTVVNALMLTAPIYMLNIYDRVLPARSAETLIALSVLMVTLYAAMAVLDGARTRVMARIAARVQTRLEGRVLGAVLAAGAGGPAPAQAATGASDLDAVQRFLSSPALTALFDLPFTPLFLAGIFLFHPLLGLLAVAGGAALVALALANQALTRRPGAEAVAAQQRAEALGLHLRAEAGTLAALGMAGTGLTHWTAVRQSALDRSLAAGDAAGAFSATTRALRLGLQSAMLGLGAFVALRGEITPGAMIAGSVLLGRALAPVESLVAQWALLQRAAEGRRNLAALLTALPPTPVRTALPRPAARLEVNGLSLLAPGTARPVVRGVGFVIQPGQAMGVIGPSGAGKTTLAQALTGALPPAAGTIRLDGATLDQYGPASLGELVGYLPQRVPVFEGTVRANIARLSAAPDDATVVAAARAAAAHEMILRLPQGYDTVLAPGGAPLSGGQVQRLGLARALYGNPVLLVLDEPNSSLDNDGTVALNAAIRAAKADGRAVVVMAHRPAAIQECDILLMLEGGVGRAFGPRDKVLREMVQNHGIIRSAAMPGGVT